MSRFGLADDRDGAASRPGGDWAGLRPTMDNPMTWSLPILRIGGVTVRLHLLFLAFIVVQLAWAIVPSQQSPVDFKLTAMALGVLLVVVLAHEFGHVLMCRLAEGEADEILMWPLGGLAMCHPPRTPRAHFWTAMGGPLVNMAIIALAAPILMLLTRDWRVVLPDPLNPLDFARDPLIARSLPTLLLYMVNALSVMVLAFNLLPLFPLDGGRILHAMLWKRKGWSGGMRIAVRVGFVVGLALAAYGAIAYAWQAVAVAAFGLIACYQTDRQLAFSDSLLDFEADDYALDAAPIDADDDADDDAEADDDDDDDDAASVRDDDDFNHGPANTKPRSSEQDEIDRILQKIVDHGLPSLNEAERALLQQETERKRRQG